MKTLSVLALMAALVLAACCKPNQPPSFWCSVQERLVSCSKETAISSSGALSQKVIQALRGTDDWDAALQALVDAAGDDALCLIGNLPAILASKPAAGPQELAVRAEALKRASAFLAKRKIRVKEAK